MTAHSPGRGADDPFGIAASLDDWCCLLRAAREIRDIDAEMMETMLEAEAPDPAKLQNLTALLRSLGLDPEDIRRGDPGALRALEDACLHCSERDRCDRELKVGSAPRTYPAFCPNASRITRLHRS